MSIVSEISEAGQVVYDSCTPKKINSLLNALKTRTKGLELLNSYLPHCPDDDFIKYSISWMQSCCKVDGFIKNRDYNIKLLGNLLYISSSYQELKKSVSFFITTRYFDYFFKYFLHSEVGWACTEICMSLYRGACGPFQETLENHLKNELVINGKISSVIARCFALLPSQGGAGKENLNYWRNWKTQFKKFVNICHLILNNLFVNVEELQEYEVLEDSYWTIKENQKNLEYLTFQLYNYCNVLNQMLLCQYPAPKAVPSDLVFQLISRGLAINVKSFGNQTTTDIIALQKMLPEIHNILLSLLKALIVTCKNQLLPYAHVICKILRQSLDWTGSEFSYRGEKPFGQVRISAYETLCNWLVVSRSGGCVESISSIVVSNAAADMSAKKDVVVLKESKQKLQYHTKEQKIRRVNSKANEKLCFAALKSLQYLLKFVGVLLKPEEHKFLQEFTIKLLVDVQKTSTIDMPVPFLVSKCRKELYSLLLKLVQHPCAQWPPPTNFAMRLFRKGVADECLQVSLVCSSALSVTVNLIHPQYNNEGILSSEAQDTQRGLSSQPMEIDIQVSCSEYENLETPESDITEKMNNLDKLDNSLQEDSTKTISFIKDANENETLEKFPEETIEDPNPKKPRMSAEIENEIPEKEKVTPEKDQQAIVEKEATKPEGFENTKSVTPELNEEIKPKKTYFLRSKTKGSSEEPEDGRSPDNLKNTPLRGLMKATPRRPRTRALSKVESESETEFKIIKKSEETRTLSKVESESETEFKIIKKSEETRTLSKVESESETEFKVTKKSEDDDEDIIAVFDDSLIE